MCIGQLYHAIPKGLWRKSSTEQVSIILVIGIFSWKFEKNMGPPRFEPTKKLDSGYRDENGGFL